MKWVNLRLTGISSSGRDWGGGEERAGVIITPVASGNRKKAIVECATWLDNRLYPPDF